MEKIKTKEEVKVESKETPFVTASQTVEFLTIGWSIQAGEEKQLPADKAAQSEILSNIYITKIK